ncbi:Lipase [Tetrabaena socialis]|uniref:Lipase n=1 Tax=Tetrabaena socialis TaxID=47790 RepID=A0A2J7ZYC1_9CHLO|nr:Lipase [Tetrabaena socialis]|eukprot:PNH05267.1 Lipase [Tetrabaena socialis]
MTDSTNASSKHDTACLALQWTDNKKFWTDGVSNLLHPAAWRMPQPEMQKLPNIRRGVETVASTLGIADHAAPRPEFDLPLAVVLAGAAFEAYLQPKNGNGFQESTIKDGPTTTYFDTSILGWYAGVLEVELVRASYLRSRDPSTFSDPYAVVSTSLSNPRCAVGSTTSCSFRTATVPNSYSPEWRETHRVCIRDPSNTVLISIQLYDNDPLVPNAALGFAMLPLGTLAGAGAEQTHTVPLEGHGSVPGATVEVRCRFLSSANAFDLANLEALTTQWRTTVPVLAGLQVSTNWASLKARLDATEGRSRAGLTPVAFLESKKTDTQVWLHSDVERREVAIAFRGTQMVKWKDIATDVRVAPCSRLEPLDDSADAPLSAHKTWVHTGFQHAYDSVQGPLYQLLDAVTVPAPGAMPWRVLVTGHSLGGALATLAAYDLAKRKRTPASAQQAISLYSYGAPRVGNEPFVEEFDQLVRNTWRVTNAHDIVPSVPHLMGYRHVGRAVQPDEHGKLRVVQETVSEDSEQAGPWNEDFTKVPKGGHATGLLEALLTGAGVKEHKRDSYLASLQLAVNAAVAQAAAVQGFVGT